MYIDRLEIRPEYLKVPHKECLPASVCEVYFEPDLEARLEQVYGRSGLCLKVFKKPVNVNNPLGYGWGHVLLTDATIIQNLMASYDIAPRVYDIVIISDNQIAQVTDFVHSWDGFPNFQSALARMKTLGIRHRKDSTLITNVFQTWVGRWWVDFGGFEFIDKNKYVYDLRTRAYIRRRKNINAAYQSVPSLGIHGSRKMSLRAKQLGIEESALEWKTVLDIGCDLGGMSRIFDNLGATRVIGVDRRAKPQLACEVSNLLGNWNIDFFDVPLPDKVADINNFTGIEQFDVVLALAVIDHVGGFAKWIPELVKDGGTFYFEGHGQREIRSYTEHLTEELQKYFSRVEYFGLSKDNYVRPLFKCIK